MVRYESLSSVESALNMMLDLDSSGMHEIYMRNKTASQQQNKRLAKANIMSVRHCPIPADEIHSKVADQSGREL